MQPVVEIDEATPCCSTSMWTQRQAPARDVSFQTSATDLTSVREPCRNMRRSPCTAEGKFDRAHGVSLRLADHTRAPSRSSR
jgi:hypothetical protein